MVSRDVEVCAVEGVSVIGNVESVGAGNIIFSIYSAVILGDTGKSEGRWAVGVGVYFKTYEEGLCGGGIFGLVEPGVILFLAGFFAEEVSSG